MSPSTADPAPPAPLSAPAPHLHAAALRYGVRAVLEAVGVSDVLTKSMGSNNPINVVRATMNGLTNLVTVEQIAAERGITPEVLLGGGTNG